jgi:hypothetical protein
MSAVEKALEVVIESVVRRVVREELAAARAAPADEMVTRRWRGSWPSGGSRGSSG